MDKILCHELVLNVWSDTFRTLIQSAVPEEIEENQSESVTNEEIEEQLRKKSKTEQMDLEQKDIKTETKKKTFKKVIRLEVLEPNVPAFKLMIEYLYRGTVSVKEDSLVPLLAVASEYNLDPLKEACATVLGNNITPDNLFHLLEVVSQFDVNELRLKVCDYLGNNFQQLAAGGMLLQLDPLTWKELIQSDDLNVDSEEQVFHAVVSYAEQFNKEKCQQILQSLLPFIRYPLMDPKSIVEIEERQDLKNITILQHLIFEAYRHKAHPTAPTTLRTEPRRGMRTLLELQKEYNRKGKWK